MSSEVDRQPLTESRAAPLPRSLENIKAPGLQFRARVSGVVERLTTVLYRKICTGFTFVALLAEGGATHFELTNA
jgi:hypothetical protein